MHPIFTYIKQRLQDFQYPAEEIAPLAKEMLVSVFGFTASRLYAGKDNDFSSKEREQLEDILDRLSRHEPIQYIVGEVCFGGMPFKVTPGVLIPRPETAELIEWVVSDMKDETSFSVLDIGTGSGCIPVSLAARLPQAVVHAWDISEEALQVAAENARINHVSVQYRHQDVFQPCPADERFRVIVSNPPYIAEKEKQEMEANVLQWEPGLALFVPDEDPLRFYRRIAEVGQTLLELDGNLYFEINRNYGPETVSLLRQMGYAAVELRKDIFGNDRMVKACLR